MCVERRALAGMGRTRGSSDSGMVCGVRREFRLISGRVLGTLRHTVLCGKKLVRVQTGTTAQLSALKGAPPKCHT